MQPPRCSNPKIVQLRAHKLLCSRMLKILNIYTIVYLYFALKYCCFDLTFSYLPIILLNFPDSAILTSQWFKRSLKRKILVTSLENVSTCTMSSAAAQKHSDRCTQQILCWARNHEIYNFRMTSKTLGWNNPDSQGTERLGRGLQKEHTEKKRRHLYSAKFYSLFNQMIFYWHLAWM